MNKTKHILVFLCVGIVTNTSAQKIFFSLDSLLNYATSKSYILKTGDIRIQQAKKARLAAVFNIIDPTINVSTSFINNTKLPISLFPAETFGGAAGSFRQVQTGIQYNSSYAATGEIKLLNLQGWESFRLAGINIDLTSSNNSISLKTLYDNIAVSYYQIVSLQQQYINAKNNLAIADTLYQLVLNKYNQGLVKQQDVNDSKASKLASEENANQINYLIKQYYISIKLLCDIPDSETIEIKDDLNAFSYQPTTNVEANTIRVTNCILNEKYALSSYHQAKKALLPTISLYTNFASQNFNTSFKPYAGSWFPSESVGLKLSLPLPNAATLANKYNAKYHYQLAQKNTAQAQIKAMLDQQQLSNDYDKAVSLYLSNKEIAALRKDSYEKNKNLYREGLISLDQTLSSYTAMINANYHLTISQANILLAQASININNTIR